MRFAKLFAFALALFAGGVASCAGDDEVRRETEVFGTRAEIVVVDAVDVGEQQAGEAVAEVFARLRESHRRFHPWRAGEAANINRAVARGELPMTVSAGTAAALRLSADGEANSGGVFNPAIGALVSLWGFHSDDASPARRPPSDAALAEWLRDPPTFRTMRLEGNVLSHLHPRARLDFGAVVKGAALDDAKTILRARGINNALVNIGGNLLALGMNGDRKWRVALRGSRKSDGVGGAGVIGEVELSDGEAVAVSGGGERYFEYAGVRYHHLLDPRTARPAVDAWTAGVIVSSGPDAGARSDIAATSLAVAQSESEARAMLKRFGIAAAFRVSRKGELWTTPEMARRLRR